MRYFLLVIFLVIHLSGFPQSNYDAYFKETVSIIEKNYIGYHYISNGKLDYYTYFKTNLLNTYLNSISDLAQNIQLYMDFFEDRHLYLTISDFYKNAPIATDTFKCASIDTHTYYLKIPDFDNQAALDSLLNCAIERDSMLLFENLVIDLRRNGGGKNLFYRRLLPLIATNDMYTRRYELLATKENWASHQTRNKMGTLTEKEENKIIDAPWQKSHHNFITEYSASGVNPYPKRVAVLVDRNTGSSAEKFVLCAKQSFKVKIFGENTAGAVDFGDVCVNEIIKDSLYIVYPTTNVYDFKINGVDSRGIAPDFYLQPENQIEQILNYFEYWN
ncbi:S41 family peptidase [Saccharicrinis sp. FJH54]|uniref:S41 family peptidase n=1 Tax=Saccharicrinis sp. FJH54 TaxID=3344665 RepID=UPI0035D4F117